MSQQVCHRPCLVAPATPSLVMFALVYILHTHMLHDVRGFVHAVDRQQQVLGQYLHVNFSLYSKHQMTVTL